MIASCRFEGELLEALTLAQWPASSSAELRSHVPACADCQSLLVVVQGLLSDRGQLENESAPLPSGMVWWRMQLRMRREAAAAAANTVTRVQRTAYTIIAAIMILFAGVYSIGAHLKAWVSGIDLHLSMPALSIAAPSAAVLSLMIATALIFAPVALYLALAKD